MAKQYWPHEDALGKGFQWGGRHITVIGVAADIHIGALDKPVEPAVYNSVYQVESGATRSGVFVIRTPLADPMRVARTAQTAILVGRSRTPYARHDHASPGRLRLVDAATELAGDGRGIHWAR